MRLKKQVIAMLAIGALSTSFAYAQANRVLEVIMTNRVNAATTFTNSTSAVLDVSECDNIGLQADLIATNGESAGVTFRFDKSMDGVRYSPNAFSWTPLTSGTTTNTTVTNVTVGAIKKLKVFSTASALTNGQVRIYHFYYGGKTYK